MNKTINFLMTCTVFVLAIQSYAKSETTIAQTPTVDEEYTPPVDEGAADEFFNQGNEEMEQDSRDLESENNEQRQRSNELETETEKLDLEKR